MTETLRADSLGKGGYGMGSGAGVPLLYFIMIVKAIGMALRTISENRVKIYNKIRNHKTVESPRGKGEGSREMQRGYLEQAEEACVGAG